MSAPDDGTYARLISKLRMLFPGSTKATGNGSSLRQSLEGVLEKHEDEPQSESDLTAEERTILFNLLEFGRLRLDDIMVPRADIIAIEENASVQELLHIFVKYHHSRTPVYRKTADDMLGMIHIKDLVAWMTVDKYETEQDTKQDTNEGKDINTRMQKNSESPSISIKTPVDASLRVNFSQPIRHLNIMRDIIFAPPSMPAVDLLIKMQSIRVHMAIIIDEYGGTDGIVTIEDLIEKIIGAIPDEHDRENEMIYAIPDEDNTYIADARVPIERAEEVLRKPLIPGSIEEDIDTLGGLVFSIVNRVPVRGEVIRHVNGVEFEILEADPRRLKKLKIHI